MGESAERYNVDRRTVLRGAGAGAITLAGLSATGGSVAGQEEEEGGHLVIIYDDSPREDYTKAFPVHENHDVPGCVAICPGLIGTHNAWMHKAHLNELHEAGWEVMSHTLKHRSLGEIPVRGDIEEGDTEIVMQSSIHGQYAGDPLVIFDDNNEVEATSAGRNDTDEDAVLVLEEPIEESFAAGNGYETWVRYTDEFTHEILEGTKAQIEEWGFGPVTAHVHPFDRYDGLVSELVPEYYEALANRHRGGLNPTFDPDPYELSRMNFEDDSATDAEIDEFLDVVANDPEFGIIYGHTHHEGFTQDRIETTIQKAKDRDIEIVTLADALEMYEGRDSNGGENGGDDTPPSDDDDDPSPADGDDDGFSFDSITNNLESGLARIRSTLSSVLSRIRGIFG